MYTPQQIAQATGAPLANVATNWPAIVAALDHYGINTHAVRKVTIATVKVETGSFLPIPEWGGGYIYEGRADLGNTQPGDGHKYEGRGDVQITGRFNYDKYGRLLGIDLLNNPDLALDPHIAALILALYFQECNIPAMANAGNYVGCRVAVNGGNGVDSRDGGTTNGLNDFLACMRALEAIPESMTAPITRVATPTPLLQHPDGALVFALDEHKKPIKALAVKTVVVFTPDPHDPAHRVVAGPRAHVDVHGKPWHGWVNRADLTTIYG